MVPALSSWIAPTATTPDVEDTSFWSVANRESVVLVAGEPSLTAIRSGPFDPGPKYLVVRSYAWRIVVDSDMAALSCCPRFSESSGIVSGIRMTRATAPLQAGCLAIPAAHFAHNPLLAADSEYGGRTRSALIRVPSMPSTAGRSVRAASTAATTEIAAISPIALTCGMFATSSDRRAIVTVVPAKNTAPPEVATAREIDSSIGRPSLIPRKWRVTMNSP